MKKVAIVASAMLVASSHASQKDMSKNIGVGSNRSIASQSPKMESNPKNYKPVDGSRVLAGFEGYSLVPEIRVAFHSDGSREFVATGVKSSSVRLTANTVVRNRLTGKLDVVTGIINVYSSDSTALSSAVTKLGLKLRHYLDDGMIQILECPANSDILVIKKSLESVRGVRYVQIDRIGEKERPI